MRLSHLGSVPLRSPRLEALLAAHQWQGASNHCGPFAAAMVLRAWGRASVDGLALARQLNRPRWLGPLPYLRRIPNWATFPWGVADVLRQHGLRAHWRWGASFKMLRRGLAQGWALLPVLGQWRPLWAHVAVLAAYHPQKGWALVDSAHPRGELVWLPAGTFARQWRAFGRLLILAYP